MKIEVRGVSFSYNGKDALKDVDLEFRKGAITGVIGPNGSGKTTMIKLLNRILSPKAGSVLVDGEDIRKIDKRAIAKKMGYVPQSLESWRPETVFNTVLLGRIPYMRFGPSKKDLEIVDGVLRELGIDDISHRMTNELSGGQRQTVVIARALAQRPRVLLFDEPTSSLDIRHQLDVMELIRRQNRRGITSIIAIHDLNLASRFCQDLVMLKEGKVRYTGGREILTRDNIKEIYDVDVELIERGDDLIIHPGMNDQ